jgi:hypothetical protein
MLVETDRMLEIVDGVKDSDSMARVQAARTRSDARRWLAGRLIGELADRIEHAHQLSGQAQIHVYLPDKNNTARSVIDGQATLLEDES